MGSRFSVGLNTRYSRLDHGKTRSASIPSKGRNENLQATNLKSFRFNELKKATRNFRPDSELGKGRYSAVFLGWIDERSLVAAKPRTGTVVAVKQIHRVIGYESDQEWSGLAYLHSTQANVRYHEFRSSIILIDSNYNAKLSDFELAKNEPPFPHEGLNGYSDLDYLMRGNLTARGEIYSFGVVLLELLTGRRGFDKNKPSNERLLANFARPFLSSRKKILNIMDPSVEGQYSSVVATRVASLAKNCLIEDPKLRPNADELVKQLEQIPELGKTFRKNRTNDN